MNVIEVNLFFCPGCREYIPVPEDSETVIQYQCSKCEVFYDDESEAEECCRTEVQE